MKALRSVGWRTVVRYSFIPPLVKLALAVPNSVVRVLLLRLLGAHIGRDTVIEDIRILNSYGPRGLGNLEVGNRCFLGPGVTLDLANAIRIDDDCTLATDALVVTHLMVGYPDHPLQAHFPRRDGGVTIRRGSYVGARAVLLHGITVGEEAFVAASSLVTGDVAGRSLVGGVPARHLRAIGDAAPATPAAAPPDGDEPRLQQRTTEP